MEFVYIVAIVILALLDSLTCKTTSSFICDEGWLLRGSLCYKWESSPQTYRMAVIECRNLNARLQMMFSMEENLHFMVNGTASSGSMYWLGLKFIRGLGTGSDWELSDKQTWLPSQYSNWYRGKPFIGKRCVEWNSWTGKWHSESCYSQRQYLCQKHAECVAGRYGADCSSECHCLGQTCNPQSGVCPYGCMTGWMTRQCNKRKTKAEAVFYCINTMSNQNEMIFSGDQKGIHYRRIRALNKEGNPVDTCDKTVFAFLDFNRNGQVLLKLVQAKNGFEPECGEEEISNNTYKWRFEFKEFPVTRSAYDVTFEVHCNFSAAEKLQRSADMSRQIPGSQSKSLSETRLNVTLDIVDVLTSKHLEKVTIGQLVKLVMKLRDKNAIGVKKIAPRNCAAGTKDGSQGIVFLDGNGCAKQEAQVVFSEGNGTEWWSKHFEMFSFSGSDHVVFTCHFDICFSDGDKRCTLDRCTQNETVIASVDNRTRRPLEYLLMGNKLVGAEVKVN